MSLTKLVSPLDILSSTDPGEGASLVKLQSGSTVQAGFDRITDTTTYIDTSTTPTSRTLANNDRFLGVGGNATTVVGPPGGNAFSAVGAEDVVVDGLKIVGDGKAGTLGSSGIYFSGAVSSTQPLRNEFKNLRIQDFRDFGIRLSAGWNNIIRQSRFVNIGKSGIAIEESPILNGWGGSGHVFEGVYTSNCGEYGISNVTGWCNTFINPVMEYNGAGFRERGDNSVWINPWLESNMNSPLIERGAVFLGGRGLTFRATLPTDLLTPGEAITWLDKRGIKVFRNANLPALDVDGNGFHAARSTTGLEISGARAATTTTRIPLVSVKGFSTPTSGGSASFDKQVAEVQINAAGDSVQGGSTYGRVVLRTGVNASSGASPNPLRDVWEFRYDGTFHPSLDNTNSIGRAGQRVSAIYAATGTINTSDERLKERFDAPTDVLERERLAALDIKRSIYRFKFTEAVSSKGNRARYHFGVGAQTVHSIMCKHGLEASDYAFWCYDVIDAESTDSPIAGMYGIRYDELCMFILAAI